VNRKVDGDKSSRSIRLLEASGYRCTAASLGPWDVIGVGPTDFVMVSVVTGQWPDSSKIDPLCEFQCPPNCKKLVHQWRDGAEQPDTHLVPKFNPYF